MEKKCFVALLMVVVMMCACWTGAVAEDKRETFTSGDYQYALLDDGTIEITKYNGSAKRLDIPAKLAGKTVTAIGESVFSSCYSLTTVTIPDSVTAIGDSAFSCCKALTTVTIPDSVEQIGMNPFAACSKLKTISVSPEHLYFATIDGVLFRKADKALISYPAGISSSTYTIPQGITAIGDGAFYSCDFLTSVSIPDSVTSIGVSAFSLCSSLTSVSIPDSVTSIGGFAFFLCNSLTLTVPRNSYAAEYAKTNNIPYTYPDANDWLNN